MTQLLAQPRLKAYEIPHKGLRNLLAQVSLRAGNTDFSDPIQVAHLHQLGRHLFHLLTEHAEDENEVTLAQLEQRQPGAAQHNTAEHEIIEAQQSRLEDLLERLVMEARRGSDVTQLAEEFYFEINRFQSGYLLHMLEEEEETQRLLWNNFTDAELLDIRRQIIARISPADILLWYQYSTPYLNHHDRVQWLRSAKAQAPAPFFGQIMAVLQSALPNADFRRLERELSGL